MTDAEHAAPVELEDSAELEGKPRMGKKNAPDRGIGGSVFAEDPESVIIIGFDTKHKQGEHPLWQPRCQLPVNEARVQNMMARGFTSVIDVRKDGPTWLVLAGRGRVKAAREANRRLIEQGKPPIKVICQVKRGSDLDMSMQMASENALRDDYTVLDQAYDAQNIINQHGSDEQAAMAIGRTVSYMKQILTLLDCPEVQHAIRTQKISGQAGLQLARLTRDEQLVELEKIKSGEYQPTAKNIDGVVKAIRKGESSSSAIVAPSKGLIRKVASHEEALRIFGKDGVRALKWVLGLTKQQTIGGLSDLIREVSE